MPHERGLAFAGGWHRATRRGRDCCRKGVGTRAGGRLGAPGRRGRASRALWALLIHVPPVSTNEQRLVVKIEREQGSREQRIGALRWIAQAAHQPEKAGVEVFVVRLSG